MAAITISRNFKWQKKKKNQLKFFMKFRSQIENVVKDYMLLRASNLIILVYISSQI